MFNTIACMIVGNIISAAAAAAPTPAQDFFSSPQFNLILGAALTITGGLTTFLLQLIRDKIEYKRQVAREELTYKRSIKGTKRERLRAAYKKVLNAVEVQRDVVLRFDQLRKPAIATDTAILEILQDHVKHLKAMEEECIEGLNEAMEEVTLEGDDVDVRLIYSEMRMALLVYQSVFIAWLVFDAQITLEEIMQKKDIALDKANEVITTMRKHLKELEQ